MHHVYSRSKSRLLVSVSTFVFAIASGHVHAQTAPANQAQSEQTEEIVVTGTRIVREGYEAPTPLTVVDSAALQSGATSNIADLMMTMPVFSGNSSIASQSLSASSGAQGVNNLNLRDLGTVRTLVLLDGQRSVGSLLTGTVDVNTFPQQLISRVDVVTGGASAVYGSDAVSGVVNFILDKTFTGMKGEASGGVTSYGDDRNFKLGLTAGFGFADHRGHVLISGEAAGSDGVVNGPSRPWAFKGTSIMNNPNYTATNGQPSLLYFPTQVGLANGTLGGIVVSGPLKGIAFGNGGVPYNFTYGDLVAYPLMHGGDWTTQPSLSRQASLDPAQHRQNLFARVAYDITDELNVFVQVSWASQHTFSQAFSQFQPGIAATILSGNPFIPASVQRQMTAAGVTSLTIGSMNGDLPSEDLDNTRQVNRNVLGASGKFDAFGSGWTWNAYYQNGYSRNSVNVRNDTRRDRFTLANDVVVSPTTSMPVCRSTLTNPTNGCIPWNEMGLNVNSDAARAYLSGTSHLYQRLTQNVLAASLQGEPFSLWAGPVSLSFEAEHRKEKVTGYADADSLKTNWFSGNYKPLVGSYSVSEGAIETVIPLAKGESWAQSWDFNAAVRFTDYTTSGFVTTYKLGTTFTPIDDIKIRVSQSRDIRAPNLNELYQAGSGSQVNLPLDPFTNTSPQYRGLSIGNPNLKPEIGNSTDAGVVLSPRFLPGFTVSVDYWQVRVSNAIGPIAAQDEVNLCYAGNQSMCALIFRNPPAAGQTYGTIFQINTGYVNLASQVTKGIDFEASYRWKASDIVSSWDGDFSIHNNTTLYLLNYTNPGVPGGIATNTVGVNGGSVTGQVPNWRMTTTLLYTLDPITASLTVRSFSSGVYDNSYIVCTSGCPASTTAHRTINANSIPGATYLDASFSYKFAVGDAANAEAFLNVRNVMGKDPAQVAQLSIQYLLAPTTPGFYDILGRVYRAGLRFKM